MGLSNVYGSADDEESRKVLRHAIAIGQVGAKSIQIFIDLEAINESRLFGIRMCGLVVIVYCYPIKLRLQCRYLWQWPQVSGHQCTFALVFQLLTIVSVCVT